MLDVAVPVHEAERSYRHRRWAAGIAGIVALPLVAAAVVLAFRPWHPVLDMAMTEFRVRDAFGPDTPLIGLPGRIGDFPDQGSHPGPLSFYLLAPLYRLAGASAYGLELGSIALNVVAIVAATMIAARLARRRGAGPATVIGIGIVLAVCVRGYGLTVLTHPWNPYLPVMLWLVVLVAAWAVAGGDSIVVVPLIVFASVAAQTHVPYLMLGGVFGLGALAVVAVRAHRSIDDDRSEHRRALGWGLGVGAVLWIPPVIDQMINDPGNIVMLLRHFLGDPPEPAISLTTAIDVWVRHLDAPAALTAMITDPEAFVTISGTRPSDSIGGLAIGGLVTLVAWIATASIAVRRRIPGLVHLHAVVAVGLVLGLVSMARIFGKVWYYLTLWAWGTTMLAVAAICWTVAVLVVDRVRSADRLVAPATVVGALAIVAPTLLSLGAVASHEVPEPQLSDGLGLVLAPTVEAIEAGVGGTAGREGSYVVFWQDAVFIGAQGYGLVNELERRGFDVGVHPTWRVPVTPQRVKEQGEVTAEIHLVSGRYIDEWRARPGYTEVVEVDARSDEQRERFDQLRREVIAELGALGRDDLIDELDVNLFGASLDPTIPGSIVDAMSEMLLLGQPVAIFIAPPGSTS